LKNEGNYVYFYGDTSHIAHYLFSGYITSTFHQDLNAENLSYAIEKILMDKNRTVVVLTINYPEHSKEIINFKELLEEHNLVICKRHGILFIKSKFSSCH
jgi:ribosomal protein L2